jgi:hypothetical protein
VRALHAAGGHRGFRASLLERFAGDGARGAARLLHFLSPITVSAVELYEGR